MLEQFDHLAQNMTVYPKPIVKGSSAKYRRNWICCKQEHSTKELLSYLFLALCGLILLIEV